MSEKQVQLTVANGPVTVSVGPGALHVVQFSLFLFDPSGTNLLQREDGFITNRRFDPRLLNPAPAALNGCSLKWRIDVTKVENTDEDQPYQVFVEVSQSNQIVPGGDIFGPPNQGSFGTDITKSFSDFVRLLA